MAREPTLRERALRLLAGREHARVELARKLARHAGPDDNVEQLLDELSQRGHLSESRYAEARTRQLSRKFGSARIAHELRTLFRESRSLGLRNRPACGAHTKFVHACLA